ncbi:MAG: heparan-alpha-glucosaminide N-acetyltransferase domain-containing protein [Leptospira sp.]|nr:heparan-alpha-glucosaminide N-acetyltransferase domain-containing protein [Leptospira sp.]
MQGSSRLVSVDIFRGITIAGMLLVNNPGSWDSVYSPLRHAKWNGCTLADLVFPFFLFIMGVSSAISISRRSNTEPLLKTCLHILKRSAILFVLGIILSGFPDFDFRNIRIPGVLQRIAVVYLISSFLYILAKQAIYPERIYLSIILAFLLLSYWYIMVYIPVPGIGYSLEPGKNLSAWVDRYFLENHLWKYTKTWDPEGVLSTFGAVATAVSGLLAGSWIIQKGDDFEKISILSIAANIALAFALIWDYSFPINKSIWTSSYVLYTTGIALHLYVFCYWLFEIKNLAKLARPFLVFGLNAIAAYFLSGIISRLLTIVKWDQDGKEVVLKTFLYNSYFTTWLNPYNASFAWSITYVTIFLGLVWILYLRKIFIKI